MRICLVASALLLTFASAAGAQTVTCATDASGRNTTCERRPGTGARAPVIDAMGAYERGYEIGRRQREEREAALRAQRDEQEREAARTEALRQEYARKDAAAHIGDLVARGNCAEAARVAIVMRDMQMVSAVGAVCKPAPQPQN